MVEMYNEEATGEPEATVESKDLVHVDEARGVLDEEDNEDFMRHQTLQYNGFMERIDGLLGM